MIEQADKADFPLIVLPPDMQFSHITKVLSNELTRRRTALLQNTLSVNQMLTQTITEGADLDEIASMISKLTGGSILIVDSVNSRHSICLKEEDRSIFKADSEAQMINQFIRMSVSHDLTLGEHSYAVSIFMIRLSHRPFTRAFIPGSVCDPLRDHTGAEHPGTG